MNLYKIYKIYIRSTTGTDVSLSRAFVICKFKKINCYAQAVQSNIIFKINEERDTNVL